MTADVRHALRVGSAVSVDGTEIAYGSLGEGRGLVIVGGALSSGSNYLPLAERLAGEFEVHLVDRRGRPGSGPQRPGHSIEDECADLIAVAEATGSTAVLGHSFGGLVALETARRQGIFELLYVYEPAVPIAGRFDFGWLDGYERLLERGDRRGAFAWMVKHAGFAPRALALMPPPYVRAVLRLAIRGPRWEAIEPLLDANLVEQRILAALDAPTAERFSTITGRTFLLGGAKSPGFISEELLAELGQVIPDSTVLLLPGLGHAAPEEQPRELVTAILATPTRSPDKTAETDKPSLSATPASRWR